MKIDLLINEIIKSFTVYLNNANESLHLVYTLRNKTINAESNSICYMILLAVSHKVASFALPSNYGYCFMYVCWLTAAYVNVFHS